MSNYKDENNRLVQSIEDQNILIDNLNSKIESISSTAENMDAFEIACDDATQHFQMSNNFLQVQIDGLVKEKADLFDRLKCLQLSESGTFEKIEIGALECQPEEVFCIVIIIIIFFFRGVLIFLICFLGESNRNSSSRR